MKFKKMKQENFTRLPKFLSPKLAVGDIPKFKEPRIIQDWVLWVEQRPNESGRSTVLIRPWGRSDLIPQELTPFPINVKSRIHGYGGAPLSIASFEDQLFLLWINDCDRCIWIQIWTGLTINSKQNNPKLTKKTDPSCLSLKDDCYFGDGVIDLDRNRWVGVMEKDNKDYLISFSLNQEFQTQEILYEAKDFMGYLTMNKNSQKLAWVEWHHPFMPWDYSYLKIASLDQIGHLNSDLTIDINLKDDINLYSIFQPVWLDSDELLLVIDNNGWWNLVKLCIDNYSVNKSNIIRLLDAKAEFALPQWINGMSTISVSEGRVISLCCLNGIWKITVIEKNGIAKEIPLPYDNFSYLNTYKDRLVVIASNSYSEPGLIELDLKQNIYNYQSSRDTIFHSEDISVAESFWFRGSDGQMTHSWYYPPSYKNKTSKPLLVKVHSGPTAMADKGLDLEVQFWTSRGWGVLDVNYGGSTGFGRKYRNRLKNNWGHVDVFDCSAAANALVEEGRADKNLIAISGSSAGGFTALSCLYSSNIFSIAACKYPVTNLLDMVNNTHRFEEGYLDYLIGSFPENQELYLQRSPINNVSKIHCPVIFFQGSIDMVVDPKQTKKMFLALQNRNLPVEMYTFADEGHGFVNSNTKIKVLIETDRFFREHLGI